MRGAAGGTRGHAATSAPAAGLLPRLCLPHTTAAIASRALRSSEGLDFYSQAGRGEEASASLVEGKRVAYWHGLFSLAPSAHLVLLEKAIKMH